MILVIDDDQAIRVSLSMLLKRAGYDVSTAENPGNAIGIIRESHPELVILDMNFSNSCSGDEGLTLLRQIHVFHPDVPVILITAWGSIPLAVEGMKAGAVDFVTKPWDNRVLLNSIANAIQLKNDSPVTSDFDRSKIIGNSPALLKVLDTVRRVASTNAPVLIMGENGTGKELIAETIHLNSRRCNAPFVKVNLGGISRSLFESEMFGHKKGAFTGASSDRTGRFELADKGTVFLDEIGELDLNSQVKLLRVLQEHTFEVLGDSRPRKVDIRVVCATNADLYRMVSEGSFREDLFYRINLITVSLPPLRERKEDIPLLARHFADKWNDSKIEITDRGTDWLKSLSYPGNIRELKNIVERAILINDSHILDEEHLRHAVALQPETVTEALSDGNLSDLERSAILRAVAMHSGNISAAAEHLGISRQALYRRIRKYNKS